MRILLTIAVALGLSGCADSGFSLIPSLGSDAAAQAAVAPDAHCVKVAKLRAGDASFAGEDSNTQRAVYDKTYADCQAWDASHNA